jgi:hypothetical protein
MAYFVSAQGFANFSVFIRPRLSKRLFGGNTTQNASRNPTNSADFANTIRSSSQGFVSSRMVIMTGDIHKPGQEQRPQSQHEHGELVAP